MKALNAQCLELALEEQLKRLFPRKSLFLPLNSGVRLSSLTVSS